MWIRLHRRWLEKQGSDENLSTGQFWRIYLTYPAIGLYLLLIAATFTVAVWAGARLFAYPLAAGLVFITYPFVEYLLHRRVLHNRGYCQSRLGARLWKRLHFDHHRNPSDLSILFGATYTTVPLVAVLTMPLGYAIDGVGGAAVGFGFGMIAFCVYEWAHCLAHFRWPVRNRWLLGLRRAHLLHHTHSERGNFGIATGVVDRSAGTAYAAKPDLPASGTVRNLGYTRQVAQSYPWVARLTPDWGERPEDA